MRRLVLGLGVVLCVLAASTGSAAAEVDVEFELPTDNGLSAEVEATDGRVSLSILDGNRYRRWGRYVTYAAKGDVRESGIEAQFGRLGKIALAFQPTSFEKVPVGPRCAGEKSVEEKGIFSGEVHFRGERGFTTIDVDQVEGKVSVKPDRRCRDGRAARASALGRGEVGALRAFDREGGQSFLAVGGTSRAGRYQAEFAAGLLERGEGMRIYRYAWAATGHRGFFDYDHEAGTAAIDPPRPFAGSGSFVRDGGPKRPGRWSGDLTVSLLGHEPLRLTGSAFRTTLNRKPPYVR